MSQLESQPASVVYFVGATLLALAAVLLRSKREEKKGPKAGSVSSISRSNRVEALSQDVITEYSKVSGKRKAIWIGICGVPGAGKTTLSGDLQKLLLTKGFATAVVPMDGYHFYRRELDTFPDPNIAHERRGAPFTFNAKRFAHELELGKQRVSQGQDAYFPSFDHAEKDPAENTIVISKDTQIVIVEGNYLLLQDIVDQNWMKARQTLHKVYYLDVNLELAKKRLATRHAHVWGWPMDKAMERVMTSDFLNMLVIKETAQYADEIIRDVVF